MLIGIFGNPENNATCLLLHKLSENKVTMKLNRLIKNDFYLNAISCIDI